MPSHNPFDERDRQTPATPYADPRPAAVALPQSPAGGRVSGFAIASLVCGLLSPLLVCACGLSLLSSLAAIMSGHVALGVIKRSLGTIAGRGVAIAGLILGYTFLTLSLGLFTYLGSTFLEGWNEAKRRHEPAGSAELASGDVRLRSAENKIISNREGTAHGNTAQAQAMARDFAEKLKTMRELLFTEGSEGGISLTDGEFVTYCESHRGRCAFVVHVPQYRHFEGDARESLADLAWRVAQQTASKALEPDDQLAVGLKGAVLFGSVRVGTVGTDGEPDDVERDALIPFFAVGPGDALDEPGNMELATAELEQARQQPVTQLENTVVQPPGESVNDPNTEQLVHDFPDMGWSVTSLAFSPDGHWLAAGKQDEAVRMFDVATGRESAARTGLTQLHQITALAFSPDGKRLFVGGSSGAIQVWDVDDRGNMERVRPLTGHDRAVRCIVPSSGGSFLVSGGEDKRLVWQKPDEPQQVRSLEVLEGPIHAVQLAAQGSIALASDGRQLVCVDLRSAQVVRQLALLRSYAHSAAISLDGAYIACSAGSHIEIWEIETGRQLAPLDASPELQWSVLFEPRGRLLSGGRGNLHVWDVHEGARLATLPLSDVLYVKTFAVSPDGRLLAAIPSAAGQTLQVLRLDSKP